MNREIKFRAWCKNNQKMLLWDEIRRWDGLSEVVDPQIPVFIVSEKERTFPYIPMQFTGLKDCKGTEIYEGDILKEISPRGNKYQVFGVKGGFALNTFQDEIKDAKTGYVPLAEMQSTDYVESQCEVIGNVWETPELLTSPNRMGI